jgi:peptide/nickel transport system permease protein
VLSFLLKRLSQAVLVMLAVSLLAFVMFRFVGDPINNMVREDATDQEKAALRERLGLNTPLIAQSGRFLNNIVHGNFGISYRNQRPVADLIAERLPATLELVLVAAVLSLALGIPLGVISALRPNSLLAHAIQTVSLIGISVPTFVTGIMLILLFSVTLNWLPSFGRGDVVHLGWWTTGFLTLSGIKALLLPALTLALYQLTLIMRLVRAEMLVVLRTDYIRFARARGLPLRWSY